MANTDKTEKATPKRRSEARKKGQVAKSTDFNGALVMIAGLVAVSSLAPTIVSETGHAMTSMFQEIARPHAIATAAGLHGLFDTGIQVMLATVAPIAAVCMGAGLLANIAQVGVRPSLGAIKPDIKRVNPATGIKNLFGPRIAFEAGKALAKVAVVAAVVALALVPQLRNVGQIVGMTPSQLGKSLGSGATAIAQRAAFAYLVIAIIDVIWQRYRHTKMLRMTKQEVKEEGRQTQLPPEVRSAIRRRQLQQARARMMAAVPQADVVVTNPTHFAVALTYDGTKPAPVVVAKGKDLVALQIRRIAEENEVPVVPDPPLARSLHNSVELGQQIPAELYAAVAQVLAFVYRMAGRRVSA